MATITISPEDLSKSAKTFRKELLIMPVHGLSASMPYMTLRTGIRYSETVGQLSGNAQFGPYSESREDDEALNITGRTLYTYLGSVVKNFAPNSIAQSIYGSAITKGEALKTADITRQVLAFLAGVLGKNLNRVLFNAVRKDAGDKSIDLFNGFDTIASNDYVAGNIAVAKGNLSTLEAITSVNAVDVLKAFARSANDELLEQESLNLIIPRHVYNDYVDDYQTTVGAIPYNKEFKKTTLEGFDNINLVPLSNKSDSKFIQLTTQKNMLVGVNQMGEEENIEVARFKAFVLQYIATMFFGCQYESISAESILFGTIDGKLAI
ncbi:MAG: hypothetical protein RR061_06155 [Muribaculaceae bacterium]